MKNKKTRIKFQAFTSTISCILTLLLVGITVLTVQSARNINAFLHDNFIMTLTLGGGNDAMLGTDSNLASQTANMQHSLQSECFVKEVRLITASEVLQQQTAVIGGNPEDFLGFNPYYSEMEIDIQPDYANSDSLKRITRELTAKYPLISEVNYEKDMMDNLNKNVRRITVVLLTLSIALLIILLTLIHNFVRMSIYARRFHIHTMKLVGADWWFIRRPFMMRSLWIGIIAGIVAIGILVVLTQCLADYDEFFSLCITPSDVVLMAIIVMLTGIFLLLLSTFVCVNHFLKMKEHKLNY